MNRSVILIAVAGLVTCSCMTPLPLKSTLPGIPVYGAQVLRVPGTRRCAITRPPMTEAGARAVEAMRSGVTLSPDVILGLMSAHLRNMECEVPWRPEAYITRDFRMSLDRLVMPLVVQTRLLRGRDGRYFDVLMEFVVYDARKSQLVGRSRAWGRSEQDHVLAASDAMRNVTTLSEFRDLLAAPSP